MSRFIAIVQILGGALLALLTVATVVNVVLIVANQENSISVVNTMIGQGVLIIFLAAMARILTRRGLKAWRQTAGQASGPEDSPENPPSPGA